MNPNQQPVLGECPDSEHHDNEINPSTKPQETDRPQMTTPTGEQEHRTGLGTKIVGGIAGAAVLVGGSLFAGEKLSHHDGPATNGDPTAEAPVVPGGVTEPTSPAETTTPSPTDIPSSVTETGPATGEQEYTVENLEVKAGLSAEEWAQQVFADHYTEWEMAGATPGLHEEMVSDPGTTDASGTTTLHGSQYFADQAAAKYTPIFAEALFVPMNAGNTGLAAYISREQQGEASNVNNWLATYKSGDARDVEPFRYWITVTDATQLSATPEMRIIRVDGVEHDNSAENRVGKEDVDQLNGATFSFTVQTTIADGVEKIANISNTQN